MRRAIGSEIGGSACDGWIVRFILRDGRNARGVCVSVLADDDDLTYGSSAQHDERCRGYDVERRNRCKTE